MQVLFSREEIKLLGKQDVKYQRALQCVASLYAFNSNHGCTTHREADDQYETNITCSCHGSSNSSYDITITVSNKLKALKRASCFCPYMQKNSKEGDLCKHILAALLKYCCSDFKTPDAKMENKDAKTPQNKVSIASSSFSLKKRQLPSWMKQSERKDLNQSGTKKHRNSIFLDRGRIKGLKSLQKASNVTRTIYCMTPDEFLRTAEEILNESKANLPIEIIPVVEREATPMSPCVSKKDDNATSELDMESWSPKGDSQLQTLLFGPTPTADKVPDVKGQIEMHQDSFTADESLKRIEAMNEYVTMKEDYSILDDLL